MVIWVNGAFGAGKTSVSRQLHRRIPWAHVLDPERMGFVVQRLPGRRRADFQRSPLWRRGTVAAVRVAEWFGPVIVPMTVVEDEVLDAVIGELRRRGSEVRMAARSRPSPTQSWRPSDGDRLEGRTPGLGNTERRTR